MDCRLESAARTLVRIECLALQGILKILFSLLSIPFIPFLYVFVRAIETKGILKLWKRILLSPCWLLQGIAFAVISPFSIVWSNISLLKTVIWAEWVNRWTASIPKQPNGRPMEILSDYEKQYLDKAIAERVLKDYEEFSG